MATQQIGYYGTAYYFIRAGEDIQDAKKTGRDKYP